jgi:hypothetical protein
MTKRTRASLPASVLSLIGILFLVAAVPPRLEADLTVLVPGGTRSILARSGDSLTGGGILRENFDKIFWYPSGGFGVTGTFFINHELTYPHGGLSRLTYQNGVITGKHSWVTGRHFNCSGTISGWGTMLSCEEYPPADNSLGYVIEAFPSQFGVYVTRTAMGRFSHEAVIEDPVTGDFYMTDDSYTGVFFKFTPEYPGYLGRGTLNAYREPTKDWVRVTDMIETEAQAMALGATTYPRLEGLVYNPMDDKIYIAVTGRLGFPYALGYILRFDPRSQTMIQWHDGDGINLANPDNIEIDSCGNLLVQEDQYAQHIAKFGPNEVVMLRMDHSMVPILRGLDNLGEMTGLTLYSDEKRMWINWMHGENGSEFIEVRMPAGWNCSPSGVPAESPPSPEVFTLSASPTPFSTETWIRGRTEAGNQVRLDIFDARGTHWRTLIDGPLPGGRIEVAWDGRDHNHRPAPHGYYFARLTAGDRTTAARMLLIR